MKKLMSFIGFALCAVLFINNANAIGLDDLTNKETSVALKEALIQAAGKAVGKLGANDGFLQNNQVKIPLPDNMKKAEKAMRMFGMGKQADDLVLKMNRAAEAAVPEAQALLVSSIKKMSVTDAKAILTGGDDAATQYFRKSTAGPMAEKFLPIVTKATANVQLAQQYNKFADIGSKYGVVKKADANLEQYVTQKALDGVYLMMAQEEATIRHDPVGQASGLIKKVFGVIGQ